MKNLKLTVLLLALFSLDQLHAQSCQASLIITPGTTPGEYTFTDNSSGSPSNSYLSIYTSGMSTIFSTALLPSNTSNPYIFSANGTYLYEYFISNAGGCIDTLWDTLNVTNIIPPCTFQAGLSVVSGPSSGQFHFTDNSTVTPQNSYLSIYDGGLNNLYSAAVLPSLSSVSYTFTANDTYLYEYIVSYAGGCIDTLWDTLSVTGISTSTNCSANFILEQDSLNTSQFYCWNYATNGTGGTAGLTYLWNFDDGSTSILAYPVHIFSALGSYELCLMITDSSGCTSTFCDTLVVTVKASGTTLNVLPAGTNLGLEETTVFQSIKLSPNPSEGLTNLTIHSSTETNIEIEIMTLSGQIIQSKMNNVNSGENEIKLDLTYLSNGVYFLQITDAKTGIQESLKMIKK